MSLVITGRVWKFGDHINTDSMAPGFAKRMENWEEYKRHILYIHKAFTQGCQPGDVIVAGHNFGCGSSRLSAPLNLKKLGIGCVVAESFARIFFRNCISIALPLTACEGVMDFFEEGEQLSLDFENSVIRNLTTGKELKSNPLPYDLIRIVREGGIIALLDREKAIGGR